MSNDIQMPTELLSQVPPSLYSVVENFWDDWCKSCETKDIVADKDLPLAVLGKTWACSDFVARNCVRYPEMLYQLLTEGFESVRSIENYREMVRQVIADAANNSLNQESKLMSALRVLRQQALEK